jgi:hypothetical protein
LVPRLDQPQTRRRALGVLAGLFGGAVAAHVQPEDAAAACRARNERCGRGIRQGAERVKCCKGLTCRKGRCRPPECRQGGGLGGDPGTCCSGRKVNLKTDPKHCGRCRNNCGSDPCIGGQCVSACAAGKSYCGGSCVDLLRNSKHCGSCGKACGANQYCEEGRCSASRQLGESCTSARQCRYDVERAPHADPDGFDNAIYCSKRSGGLIPGIVACDDPLPGLICCVGRGAACSSDCDCCGQERCLGESGCGIMIDDGLPCPSVCPADGPCDLCHSEACVNGFCNAPLNPTCRRYGDTCAAQPHANCCGGVPCIGGYCRYN